MKKAIPYYRVSTERQGQSGLGLEAQQKLVRHFAKNNKYKLIKEFIEVESGRNKCRPLLNKAIEKCRKENAVLLIATLDRLARRVSFIANLMEESVMFICVDMPYAETFFLHLKAAFAQKEHEEISKRTKAALAAAKARGVRLGNPKLPQQNRRKADAFARKMRPIIKDLKRKGFDTTRELMKVLNQRRIRPFSGKNAKWHTASVHRLLKRIEKLRR